AEDNPENQLVVQEFLKRRGWTVVTVPDGKAALASLQEGAFDAVLMDVQMPQMDGYEATRALREREHASGRPTRTPVVGLTAHAMRGDKEKCLEAGMDDYLPKPVEAEALYAVIERLVRAP
ncbi:MAG: response regulator, partial [Deltaproteobacteria bacterium]|nr:response regulator [Deltaproteobacteria bacterium]